MEPQSLSPTQTWGKWLPCLPVDPTTHEHLKLTYNDRENWTHRLAAPWPHFQRFDIEKEMYNSQKLVDNDNKWQGKYCINWHSRLKCVRTFHGNSIYWIFVHKCLAISNGNIVCGIFASCYHKIAHCFTNSQINWSNDRWTEWDRLMKGYEIFTWRVTIITVYHAGLTNIPLILPWGLLQPLLDIFLQYQSQFELKPSRTLESPFMSSSTLGNYVDYSESIYKMMAGYI